jgi:hypothetical protein
VIILTSTFDIPGMPETATALAEFLGAGPADISIVINGTPYTPTMASMVQIQDER